MDERRQLIKNITRIQQPLQKLHSKLVYWGEESDAWITKFHIQLEYYYRIYATDFYPRSSLNNSRFNKYLRKQYDERLRDLKSNPDSYLRFSKPVYDAIMQTGWLPDQNMWGNYDIAIKEENHEPRKELEVARILIRPKLKQYHRQTLENLDYDHKLFAIPLFVIEDKELHKEDLVEFAIGFNDRGCVSKCYKFDETNGNVIEVGLEDGLNLAVKFENLLRNNSLKTVDEFLGNGVMIKDPKEFKSFAETYDISRKASTTLLNKLRQNLNPSFDKVGLDIGCGTGNYTMPFINEFGKVIGLDISREMLKKAKEKPEADKVTWIEGNALNTGLPNESCDAVWLISTLHYFFSGRQNRLFREIHRILKPGGTVLADTEFKEQHDSLWLVEFFPSLKDRYKNVCLSAETYKKWLSNIGFTDIKFEHFRYEPYEEDAGLRIGQHDPSLYLIDRIRNGIPAFKQMRSSELEEGLNNLRTAIHNDSIFDIMKHYTKKATMEDDVGVIIATRMLD